MPSLAKQLPGLRYAIADSYGLTTSTETVAAAGFVSVDSACCGARQLHLHALCQPRRLTLLGPRPPFSAFCHDQLQAAGSHELIIALFPN
ncbi:hypothetical protein PR202_ga14331 [Eleusine coracana subsp. coracana]|uniref:Uncharacterized protein n=1 Tax=Eleusine coracana subsp. coracana TaxID=191504 RepID=A0AAV5CH48_ELECO|nr:hypothetical protein PR202_ga14331 [Eleusine coracana subsp. coracana]